MYALFFIHLTMGKLLKDSDIDVAIWDNKFTGSRPPDIEKIISIKVKYPGLELHTFHSSDTKETNSFIGEILKRGIPIKTE